MTAIDTSGIDATKPTSGEAATSSVRDNFSAIKTQLDVIANGELETTALSVGEMGTENGGININGTTYSAHFKVSDINDSHLAESIIHRHSTTYPPLMIMARSNSDGSSHGTISAGQVLSSYYSVGWTGTHYDIFGEMRFSAGTGSISSTSSPGKWALLLSPDGSSVPAAVITADSNKSVTFGGTLTATNGGSLTGTWSNLGTVTTMDLNGGTIDGVTIGATSAPTVTNLGSVTTCDINGGTIDGVTIGGAAATTIGANTTISSYASLPAGTVIQAVYTQDGAVATGTTTIPLDDTIPQNTEGNEFLTLSITPKYNDSLIIIEASIHLSHSANDSPLIMALFQDATASALAATWDRGEATAVGITMTLSYTMISGTTSSTTMKIRAGSSVAGTVTFNGASSARLFGGISSSYLKIIEIKQ